MRALRNAANGQKSAGFTLVELLVVLAILGLLVAIAVPNVLKYLGKAKTDVARIQIHNLGSSLDLYRLDVGHYPPQDEGLQVLVSKPANDPGWNGPYLKNPESLIDPWGNPYVYRIPGEHGDYDLYTLGADKASGGSGENQDVGNW